MIRFYSLALALGFMAVVLTAPTVQASERGSGPAPIRGFFPVLAAASNNAPLGDQGVPAGAAPGDQIRGNRWQGPSTLTGSEALVVPLGEPIDEEHYPKAPADLYQRGQWAIQYCTGYLYSPMPWDKPLHRDISFLTENVRISRVAFGNNPYRPLFKGSMELVAELETSPILHGPGNIILGTGLYLRYNFSQRSSKFIPYAEIGLGVSYTDIYKVVDAPLSLGFNFIIHSAVGTHYFVTERWSLDLEAAFYHLSNNGWGYRNRSVNGLGIQVGATYYFGRHRSRSY